MLCFRCGSPVVDTATSCANCGQDLRGSSRPDPAGFSEIQKKLRQSREWVRPSAYQVGDVVVDRYEIQDVVGEGGLGIVYKALDQEVEVEVALKIIAPEALPDEAARLHCLATLQPLRDLVHENVVRTFDVDRDGERCFYVMQFLEGLTLRKILKLRREKGQRFAVSEIEPIYAQLCRALGESSRRMAHGGLKPENVVILPDLLKITDFGLAAALPRPAYLAAQRAGAESFAYLAPEVRHGEPFDARADVYSVGVILVELLSGMSFVQRGSADGLDDVPLQFERVLRCALSENPAQRYAHAGELGEDLTAALTGKRIRSTQPYGAARGEDLVPTRELHVAPREASVPEEPTLRRSTETLEEALPRPDLSVPSPEQIPDPPEDAEEPETGEVAAPHHEGSGLTHQLDFDDIEFASQQARLERLLQSESELEDDLLLKPPPEQPSIEEPDAGELAGSTTERTEKVSLADLAPSLAE